MLGTTAVAAVLLTCVVNECPAHILNITLGQMEPAHAAVVMSLAFVVSTVRAFSRLAHRVPLLVLVSAQLALAVKLI